MGAGRKTQNFSVSGTLPFSPNLAVNSVNGRNLGKYQLGGVIFGCKNSTMQECHSKQLFGLPAQHFSYVKNIDPGLPLFLFNYSDRKLHGIFEASSKGKMYIDPYAWGADSSERTQYPAQVQIRVRLQCQPLSEDKFGQVIADNYYTNNHFWFELDHRQTSKLTYLLASLAIAPGIPRSNMKWRIVSPTVPSHEALKEGESFETHESEIQDFVQSSGKTDSTDITSTLDGEIQPLDTHSVVRELMQEVEELMAFKETQTQKNCYLEKKLMKAALEIQQLKDRCTMLESAFNLPVTDVEKTVIQPSDELHLDPKESLFLKGFDGGESWLSAMDLYCPSKNVIKSLKPSSVHSYALVVQLNGELYVFVGENGCVWYDTVESCSSILGKWTLGLSLNQKKESMAAVSLNNKIFTIGGGNGVDCFSNVEMLDLDNGRQISICSILEKRFDISAVVLNGSLYVTGGYNGIDNVKYAHGAFDGCTMVPSIELFDPCLGAWMIGELMNHPKEYFAAAVKESIYVIGDVKVDENIVDTSENNRLRIIRKFSGSTEVGDDEDDYSNNHSDSKSLTAD
ncbi:Kelch-type beta propeller [Sesbania bispinosa]|nr:Kelch-type beta propeller [Sesbania bispinosa]